MLNRRFAPPAAAWLLLGIASSDVGVDEVSCLQSVPQSLAASSRQTELVEFASASIGGSWLYHLWQAKPPVSLLERTARRIDGTDTTVMFLVFGLVLFGFFLLLACFAQMAFTNMMKEDLKEVEEAAKAAQRQGEAPFIQPAEGLKDQALPAICSQFMSAMHQPFVVPLKPIQESKEWTLHIYSEHSARAILSASVLRGGGDRPRSCLEVRNAEKDQLLGTITSSLEILVPDGRRYGRLVSHRGEYLLQEDSGREPRWSMAEADGMITVVWLPERGTGQRLYQDLKDGLHRLGKRAVNQRNRGQLLATVARPDGSNGHRLELKTVGGLDAVLVVLCALGLVTFDGVFEIIDPAADFQSEKAGPAKADPSPAVNSSLSTGTSTGRAKAAASDAFGFCLPGGSKEGRQ